MPLKPFCPIVMMIVIGFGCAPPCVADRSGAATDVKTLHKGQAQKIMLTVPVGFLPASPMGADADYFAISIQSSDTSHPTEGYDWFGGASQPAEVITDVAFLNGNNVALTVKLPVEFGSPKASIALKRGVVDECSRRVVAVDYPVD